MRIVSGKFRGRKIFVPNTHATRPTMDRTREAVFNMLLNAPWAQQSDGRSILNGAVVLDVFAGSGAYGLEALSHRAKCVTFLDHGKEAIQAIKRNIETFNVQEMTRILRQSPLKISNRREGNVADIAFFDPPYGEDLIIPSVEALHVKNWINEKTYLVFETESKKSETLPANLEIFSQRVYGKSKISIGYLLKS